MKKQIDPLEVKQAIKEGQLECVITTDFQGTKRVMLKDTESGECACLLEVIE